MLALAKHPEVIVLDEPTASLDPLARREVLRVLMDAVATDGATVVLSSHNVADLERVCDHLVILSRGRVQVAENLETFLGTHRLLIGPRASTVELARAGEVIHASHTERQTTALVRVNGHLFDARWEMQPVGFEEIVLGYLGNPLPAMAGEPERIAS